MKNNSVSGRIFDVFNYVFLFCFAILAVLPFIHIIAASFADEAEYLSKTFLLIPQTFNLNAYKFIFSSDTLINSIGVSVYITAVGTLINLFFTLTMAYPLSQKHLKGRTVMLNMIIFSMLFSGGMIPNFLLIKSLNMLNTFWAVMIPGAISAYNLIIIKRFFEELPPGLIEAAKIDGCNDISVLVKIILPLSMPIIATFGLFYAVSHWNDFFSALLYLDDSKKWPLQIVLRQYIIMSQGTLGDMAHLDSDFITPPEQVVKMAVIVIAAVPILMVYPFLQKYFAKGIMIGAIKG